MAVTKVRTKQQFEVNADTSFGNFRLTSLATPTADSDAATKAYVDATRTGLDFKQSVRVASTANISVTYNATAGTTNRGEIIGAPNIVDGVTLAVGNRILLKDQSTGAQNGIWSVTAVGSGSDGVWARASDFDQDSEVTAGAFVFVEEGSTNSESGWVLSTNNPITIGGASGTALTWILFSVSTSLIAGSGLTKTGNVLDVNVDNSTLEINSDILRVKAAGISLTTHVTGTLPVANGGTGATTLTGVTIGNGTSAFTAVASTAGGQLLRRNAGDTAYEFFTPTYVSAAIISLGTAGNPQSGATQTLAVGTSGTDFNISSASNTHTFNIPSASATARGLVTTAAQTFAGDKTFNNAVNIIGTAATGSAETWAGVSQTVGYTLSFSPTSSVSAVSNNSYVFLKAIQIAVTEAASGTHSLLALVGLKPLIVTEGAATTTNAATLYIEGAATGTATITNNYAVWVDAGTVRLDGEFELNGISTADPGSLLTYNSTTKRVSYGGQNVASTATPTFRGVLFGGGTVTSSTPMINATQTWNSGGVTFNAQLVNITDTASAAASTFVTYQLGGVTQFAIRKDGTITTGSWAGSTISVSSGGTGATTLTGVVIGNGTGAMTGVAGTASQLLRRNAANTAYEFFSPTFIGSSSYIVRESLAGANGSTAAFTLANTPIAGKEMVFVNGVLQNAGSGNDYQLSGTTITFETAAIPQSGDVILVTYLI